MNDDEKKKKKKKTLWENNSKIPQMLGEGKEGFFIHCWALQSAPVIEARNCIFGQKWQQAKNELNAEENAR